MISLKKELKILSPCVVTPPKGEPRFVPHPEGFKDTCQMISALKDVADFNIFVGAYPHKHPEAKSIGQDVEWLKRKFDSGASEAITQFFFEADDFFRFRDACAKAGFNAPIVPGILPIENWENTKKFAARCGAKIPAWMDEIYRKATRDELTELLLITLSNKLYSQLIDGELRLFTFTR
jgi:methylenetetrahydrofolate reductase (NADPH)